MMQRLADLALARDIISQCLQHFLDGGFTSRCRTQLILTVGVSAVWVAEKRPQATSPELVQFVTLCFGNHAGREQRVTVLDDYRLSAGFAFAPSLQTPFKTCAAARTPWVQFVMAFAAHDPGLIVDQE